MKALTPAERLYVALDFKPDQATGRNGTHARVMEFAKKIAKTGIGVKLNADLRAWGEGMIDEIHSLGLRIFVDLKLDDIGATMERDGMYLSAFKPEVLTVMCFASSKALRTIKTVLPETKVVGVTVLTDIPASEISEMFECSVSDLAHRLADHANKAGLDGLVCSPHEAARLRTFFPEMTLVTPGVRDPAAPVKNDDQQRMMTPAEAIAAGADCLVIGRPIVEAPDPYAAAMRFLEQIAKATA